MIADYVDGFDPQQRSAVGCCAGAAHQSSYCVTPDWTVLDRPTVRPAKPAASK